MPAYIAGFRKELAFDIIAADVPLLLSLQNLKSFDLTIQYRKNGADTTTHKLELELAKAGSIRSIISRP